MAVTGMRRLAPALIIPLIIISFVGGYMLAPSNTTDTSMQTQPGNVITITPILRVYDEAGNLIVEKVGDPPTDNLAHLFMLTIAPRYKTDGTSFTISTVKFDGTAVSIDPGSAAPAYQHTLWIVAGTDTNPPSYSDYTMQLAAVGEAKTINYYFDSTTNEWVLQVTGTLTFSASYNITSVGLTTDVRGSSIYAPASGTAEENLLVFRDLLPQSIQVQNGDSISVQYEIRFKLP